MQLEICSDYLFLTEYMTIETALVELVSEYTDYFGYITYVFKYLDNFDINVHNCKIMVCTRYPNWNCRELKIGDTGYVEVEIVRAGIDTWFDGKKQVPYKNNATRFMKFIEKSDDKNKGEYTL